MTGTSNAPATSGTISVVIAHLNQPQMLDRCLRSIMEGRRPPEEVIVVDNGSTELPVAICAQWPEVRLMQEPVPGPGPARSTGARAATGTVLAFTDADCLTDPGWLEAAMATLASHPDWQILGGDVRIAAVDPDRLTMLEAYESIWGFRVERYIREENFTVTCNLITRPAVMQAVGEFAGLSVAEDIDWGHRATAMGYRIHYCPDVLVRHPARPCLAALKIKWDRHTAHFFHDATQKRLGRLKWALRTVIMALSPLGEIPALLGSDRIFGARSRWLAFVGMTRIRLYRARLMAWLLFGGDPARLAGRWNRPAAGGR
ncbi:MAG TPA: glycosyltransferase [Paenirhodobacter sp.]